MPSLPSISAGFMVSSFAFQPIKASINPSLPSNTRSVPEYPFCAISAAKTPDWTAMGSTVFFIMVSFPAVGQPMVWLWQPLIPMACTISSTVNPKSFPATIGDTNWVRVAWCHFRSRTPGLAKRQSRCSNSYAKTMATITSFILAFTNSPTAHAAGIISDGWEGSSFQYISLKSSARTISELMKVAFTAGSLSPNPSTVASPFPPISM